MADMIFKRKIYDEMLSWKRESGGQTALLIEGPRRVGKSTIVREFAQREYRSHVIIDFAKASAGNKLFYYTWEASGNHFYEVDFLLSRGFKLWPIEVKSSGYSKHKSLDEFCKKFSSRISNRYLVYTKDLRKDGETLMIPIYMVGLL